MADARTIIVRSGSSSSAGILLLFLGIIGLVALFTGNLDRWINAISGQAGGAEGIVAPGAGRTRGGSFGDPPELALPPSSDYGVRHPAGGAQAAAAARAAGFPV